MHYLLLFFKMIPRLIVVCIYYFGKLVDVYELCGRFSEFDVLNLGGPKDKSIHSGHVKFFTY